MADRAANRAHTLFRNMRWMDTHHFNTIFRMALVSSRLSKFLSGFLKMPPMAVRNERVGEGKMSLAEHRDRFAKCQQVLFDLLLLGPRRLRRPFQDVGLRDQDRSPGGCGFAASIGGRFVRFLARPGADLRKRWKLAEGGFADWDYMHGEVEVYNDQGMAGGRATHSTSASLSGAAAPPVGDA
jgi:Cytotoxic